MALSTSLFDHALCSTCQNKIAKGTNNTICVCFNPENLEECSNRVEEMASD